MIIGVLGLEFGSGNKGCEALAFSFLFLLDTLAAEEKTSVDVRIFMNCDTERIMRIGQYQRLTLTMHPLGGFGGVKKIRRRIELFKKCDYIFDFTAGDSFSDIYGMERFIRGSLNKQLAIWSGTRFILGSQTYGPFHSWFAKKWSAHIIKKSRHVISRDTLSTEYVLSISGVQAVETIDIAFELPFKKVEDEKPDRRLRVGFNPSGLLWSGGYTGDNQFGLNVEYQVYCKKLISCLLDSGEYDVYLIPHVGDKNMEIRDNDLVACNRLTEMFPLVHTVKMFDNPIDAKSFISTMDIFIGARMHATVAALSSGVVTIPTAYSRKFEGVFKLLEYNHVIDLQKSSTEDAIRLTLEKIKDYDNIFSDVKSSIKLCDIQNAHIKEVYHNIIFNDK